MLTNKIFRILQKYWTVTPIPTLTYTAKYYTPFVNAQWNFGQMAPILFSVLGDYFGNTTIVYGLILIDIIGLIWIRQEDAAPPLFIMLILSSIFVSTPGFIPEEFKWLIVACIYVTTGGIAYVLWKGRRVS
jgi:hypothetical protein